MDYSLNQVEHTARKAVRGAGLPWGLAEDTGRAVRWLQSLSLGGVGGLAGLLGEIDDEDPMGTDSITLTAEGWQARGPAACLLVGGAISDCLGAGSFRDTMGHEGGCEDDVIRACSVSYPLLCAGFAGVAAGRADRAVWLSWDDLVIECRPGQLAAQGRVSGLNQVKTDVLTIHPRPPDHFAAQRIWSARIGACRVDAAAWQLLERFASRTYVPASASSRLSGAGAGVTDND